MLMMFSCCRAILPRYDVFRYMEEQMIIMNALRDGVFFTALARYGRLIFHLRYFTIDYHSRRHTSASRQHCHYALIDAAVF